jgi:hypothetical protein
MLVKSSGSRYRHSKCVAGGCSMADKQICMMVGYTSGGEKEI